MATLFFTAHPAHAFHGSSLDTLLRKGLLQRQSSVGLDVRCGM
jgi:hypothetical protein